jgi:hypothetical protein
MNGDGHKLTAKQEAAIAALLTAPNLEKAAEQAGVSISTLKRWRKDNSFRQAYAAARAEILERTTALLLDTSKFAVATLRKCLTSGKESDRIRAANAILSHAMKSVELNDLAERLAELEHKLGGTKR